MARHVGARARIRRRGGGAVGGGASLPFRCRRVRENLLDLLGAELRAAGAEALCENVELRRTTEPFADATLRFAGGGWREAPAGRTLVDRLAAAPWCRSPRAKGGRLTLRIADEHVAALGGALESGVPTCLDCADLLDGRTVFVDFHGANTTKALHVGHLRNIAVGNAYAAASRIAGARVTTQSHGSDFGRQMAEAAAGYLRF